MAVDPPYIDASSGSPSYSGADLRLGALLPMLAGAGASLGIRSGVRASGSGTDLLVQAQSSPNMTVKVNTGAVAVTGAISTTQGPYTWALDTLTNVTIAASHATLSRTDLIVVRIRDAGVDTSGGRDGSVQVVTGTAGGGVPALPSDATYLTLAQIAVGAAVTSIVTGNITDKRVFTAALGGIIPCLSTARPSSPAPGQAILETDTTLSRVWDGATWWMSRPYRQVISVSVAAATMDFQNIPSTLKKITITWSGKSTDTPTLVNVFMRVNNNSGTNYFYLYDETANATLGSGNTASQTWALVGTVPGMPAGVGTQYATGVIDIMGWDSTSSNQDRVTYHARSANYRTAADSRVSMYGGAAIVAQPWTRLTLFPFSGNWGVGSEAILEGWD